MKATLLNFYGIRFLIQAPVTLISKIEAEFSYFIADSQDASAFAIRVLPEGERSNKWRRLFETKWSTVYLSKGDERRVRFFENAWVAYRFESGECDIYCNDPAIAFEVAYLVLLSAVGEVLDRRGLHRVHGMGICREGRGILFLGTSGVGKSSLAMEFLKESGSRILSDDTPLVEESGGMLAFPQRIALKEAPQVDGRFFRKFARTQFGEKFVVGAEYFKDRVQPTVLTDAIVYLRRQGGESIQLKELPRFRLFLLLVRWLVIGHETPQIWQLYLRLSPLSLWWKSRILVSRFKCAWTMSRRCRPWRVDLGSSARVSADQLKHWISDGTLQTRVPGIIS